MARCCNGIIDQGAGLKLMRADKKDDDKSAQLRVAERAILDSDSIVTAMILGLCRERVGRKREIVLTLEKNKDAEKNAADLKLLKDATEKINKALATTGLSHLPLVKSGYAPAFLEGSASQTQNYITGKHHGAGLPRSLMRDAVALKPATSKQFFGEQTHADLYKGRGAYTGVHTVNGEVRFWGSTFRHDIPEGQGRWIPKKYTTKVSASGQELLPWGLIGDKSTIDAMHNAPRAGSHSVQKGGGVVGYTHGMVQALYSAAFHGFKGTTIEVAVGNSTTKMASCFACTTFMCATDYPPDAIHLGRGESWAPVFTDSASFDMLAERFNVQGNEKKRLHSAVQHMNQKWYAKCASWLYWGSRIDLDRVKPGHQTAWRRVQKFAEEHRHHEEKVANLFLDALTVHCGDAERVDFTLVK